VYSISNIWHLEAMRHQMWL